MLCEALGDLKPALQPDTLTDDTRNAAGVDPLCSDAVWATEDSSVALCRDKNMQLIVFLFCMFAEMRNEKFMTPRLQLTQNDLL